MTGANHGTGQGGAVSREVLELTTLYEVTKALSASADLRVALREAMKILAQRMGMVRGTVTIVNPATSELQIEVAHGLSAEARRRGRYKLGEGITGQVVATGQPMVIPRIGDEPRFLNRTRSRGAGRGRDVSFICVPIQDGGQTIGALSVDRQHGGPHSSFDQDLRLLTIVSGLIAQTVKRIQAANAERDSLLQENIQLKAQLAEKYSIGNIIGRSSRMQEVFEMVRRVAGSQATVLLRGESGTGKSMIARAIHYNSPRRDGPFVTVNCSALPETLIESELFGHEKGAFTGAHAQKVGRFEAAKGGTIFLDEVGDLPHNVQVKLLNVIQEREFQRVGGTRVIKADVRIIAATNKNLEDAMERGQFREDLYYRLNVFPIFVPPLRERKTDILLLAEHFLQRFAKENGKEIKRISSPAIDLLMQYHWPGNVRELQNCMERAVLICDEDVIRAHHLPPSLQTMGSAGGRARGGLSFAEAVARFEQELIIEALKEAKGNQTRAARLLDTSLRILNYKVKKYNIDPRLFKPPANGGGARRRRER